MTFSISDNGQDVDLKSDGSKIPLDDLNKYEYIELYTRYRIDSSFRSKDASEAFKRGFFELIPNYAIKVFDARDLSRLIYGDPSIDLDLWRAITTVNHGPKNWLMKNADENLVDWFWKVFSF